MPIGDIADRYSICKLKNERLNLSNETEISELISEINNYDNIEPFIDRLYKINGNIWDLESDIRKKNEHILGLEEVGRRAIKIRELNNIRVEIKNEINSIYNEGFIEVKMNHGSEKTPDVVVSLTTVPERLLNNNEEGIKKVIEHLCIQKYDGYYEVHFNIPKIYSVTNEAYILPEWVDSFKIKYPHLKIFRTEDYGPPTKFVPTVMRLEDPETIILVVDDDLIYHEEMVSEHKKYQDLLNDSVICYDGRGSEKQIYNGDLRDSWIICNTVIRETHFLQHYKSASYKKKLFKNIFFKKYLGKTLSDDVLISKYFRDEKIKIYSVPYEKENHLFETKELWDKNQGVVTFPILRQSSSIDNTGCNNPKLLQIQPKFYEPQNWSDNEIDLNKFSTDKISHGYMEVYSKVFEEKYDSKNILHIGIKDDSLKLIETFFPFSKIYATDLTQISTDNDKIKTYVVDQSKIESIENFVSKINFDFDIIIDDGGHTMVEQQNSFGILFKKLKSGGVYIIEDLHTSNIERFKSKNDKITTLEMLNNFKNNKKIISNYISEENINYIENFIDDIEIWSKTPNFDVSVTSVIKKIKKNYRDELYPMRHHDYSEGLDNLIDYINKIYDTKEMTVLEIGSYAGESTEQFAQKFKSVISIDPFIDDYDVNDPACGYMQLTKVYNVFKEKMSKYKNVKHIKKTSDDAINELKNIKVDLVYIDGLHTYKQVKRDIDNYLPIISDSGFISGHDYHPVWQGVVDAIHEKIGEPEKIFKDTSWIKKVNDLK